MGFLAGIGGTIASAVTGFLPSISNAVTSLLPSVSGVVSGSASSLLSGLSSALVSGDSNLWGNVTNFASSIIGTITGNKKTTSSVEKVETKKSVVSDSATIYNMITRIIHSWV
jgi:hypothetical protein